MLEVYRCSSVEWKPSPVVALATSADDSQVAAAREDGSLEIWLVSPGSVGWHCQLTIHGDPNSRVSSLIWCRTGSGGMPCGRLFSSSIDGSVSEWDLFDLTQKTALESTGVSIWSMAATPCRSPQIYSKSVSSIENGHSFSKYFGGGGTDTSDSDDNSDAVELHEEPFVEDTPVAIAFDDGCVRIYSMSDLDQLIYVKSLPRVSGRVLSVTWSPDAKVIYSGSSDGFIRCWDAKLAVEIYRITARLGGLGSGHDFCIWSLLALRCGTLVSADSAGHVQFWDSQHGTLLQAHAYHKGDANALAAVPDHRRVFSSGSDGQVVQYKLSTEADESGDELIKKWVYVGYVRAHTHDARALTVAVPISREDMLPEEKVKRIRTRYKPLEYSYRKWAQLGVPMLISAGDDTKLFAYSAKEFTKFSPFDICPAPGRPTIQLVNDAFFTQKHLLLIQASQFLDVYSIRVQSGVVSSTAAGPSGGLAGMDLVVRVKSKASRKIVCSTISSSGMLFAYSDQVKPTLFELKSHEGRNSGWSMSKRRLPSKLPFAHSMVFSSDSSQLLIAGHDRRIYVIDMGSLELSHTFTPSRKEMDEDSFPGEPPITRMFTSSDGQWLAAVSCFGDVYVFNLEIRRQHWFIPRLDGASVTAGGFSPQDSNVLILSTSLNQVYVFDVDAKQLGEWSMHHTFILPRRYQDFPGEVIGLSFPPSSKSSTVVIYSPRAMCFIDFGMPIDKEEERDMPSVLDSLVKKHSTPINGRLKRKGGAHNIQSKHSGRKNFEFCAFREPVLFVGHLSNKSVLIVDKPWIQVLKSLDTQPVHRHVYGT